jgi:hypothetical protein
MLLLERMLMAANWGLKHFERYTAFSSKVIIKFPHAAEVAVLKRSELPLCL